MAGIDKPKTVLIEWEQALIEAHEQIVAKAMAAGAESADHCAWQVERQDSLRYEQRRPAVENLASALDERFIPFTEAHDKVR